MEIVTREIALARGLKRYYTDEPCRGGHTEGRYTRNDTCVVCRRTGKPKRTPEERAEARRVYMKDYWERYYEKNREVLIQKQKVRNQNKPPPDNGVLRLAALKKRIEEGGAAYVLKRETQRITREEREKARKRGDTHFKTGIACKNGHIAPRYTATGKCTECLKVPNEIAYARNKEWRARNPEKYREYMREYHRERRNRPEVRARIRENARARYHAKKNET